jgi:hypothetical protein
MRANDPRSGLCPYQSRNHMSVMDVGSVKPAPLRAGLVKTLPLGQHACPEFLLAGATR